VKDFNVPHRRLVNRRHLSCDDCLEDKSEDYQNCSVLYCVPQLYTVISTHVWAGLKRVPWWTAGPKWPIMWGAGRKTLLTYCKFRYYLGTNKSTQMIDYNLLIEIDYSFAWKLETISPAIKLYFHWICLVSTFWSDGVWIANEMHAV